MLAQSEGVLLGRRIFVHPDILESHMFIGNCYLCTRPRFLYGSRDVETGWLGWCTICNSKWHAAECKIRLDRTQLVVRYCKQHAHIVTELLIDFLAPNTRCLHERAQRIFWCKLLLGSNMAYYLEHSWRCVVQEESEMLNHVKLF